LRLGAFRFTPRLVPTLAAAAAVAATLWLALWQSHRAEEKEARQAMYDARQREMPVELTGSVPSPEPLLYRRVTASGTWVPEGQIYIDNQVHEGRAGFVVVTPLRLASGDALLVNRGWVERSREYPRAPRVAAAGGAARVTGLAVVPPKRVLELSTNTVDGDVWQNLSIGRYREAMHMRVLPVVLLADEPGQGLVAVRETMDAGAAKHREYELTWLSLAFTVAALWIVLNLSKSR
jgi:surfeit locus 1 family protein